MKYQGGKHRLAKEIGGLITACLKERDYYLEPFLGGGSIFTEVAKTYKGRMIGSDIEPDLISLWRYIKCDHHSLYAYVTEEIYRAVKENPLGYAPGYRGLVSMCSYRGKMWGGYARKSKSRDSTQNQLNLIRKQSEILKNTGAQVEFHCRPYTHTNASNAVIYCDPPYANTTGYRGQGKFDHASFWAWAEKESENNTVLVSELSAPSHWQPLWTKEITRSMTARANAESPRVKETIWILPPKE